MAHTTCRGSYAGSHPGTGRAPIAPGRPTIVTVAVRRGSPRAYIRHALLEVSAVGRDRRGQVAPEAAGAVKAFRECGWEVVVVGGSSGHYAADLGAVWRGSVEEPDRGAWLLTDQVSDDRWARPLGIRTALVGPQTDRHDGPSHCDVAYRDLRTAALEILATEVEPGADTAQRVGG